MQKYAQNMQIFAKYMHKYALNMHLYAQICKQNMQNICIKYANIC